MGSGSDRAIAPQRTRRLLLAGFGGLLALMAFASLDAMRVLRTIQNRNDAIRGGFLTRNRLLNQIRSDLYLSGTYVRDYLLEPQPELAESHRKGLENTRTAMDLAVRQYAGLLRTSERVPFENLEQELARYWRMLQPVMLRSPETRPASGYPFLRDQVYPRRTAMLGLADEISRLNEEQLNRGQEQVSELFLEFRLRLTATLVVTLGLGLLLASFSVVRILNLEREAAARFEEASQARAELKRLSARLVEAQESERRTISRELHDEVGQALTAVSVGLSNLAAAAPQAWAPTFSAEIESLRMLIASCVGVVRNMTLLLRPSMLDDLGLVPALQWQAREASKRSGVAVNFSGEDIGSDLPDEHKTAIYRIVQEALHNCEKHAQAREIRVTVRQQGDALLLSIQDDGQGFRQRQPGLGLRGMQERVENLGGIFNVESEAGRGSLITVRLPLHSGCAAQHFDAWPDA